MEKELKIIKKWGLIYIVLIAIGGIGGVLIGLSNEPDMLIIGLLMIIVDTIYAFILYVIVTKVKGQNIIIEQNKEIIKLLSK